MVKVAVVGVGGRMGKVISSCIVDSPETEIGGGTEMAGHPALGQDLGEVVGLGKNGQVILEDLSTVLDGADVVIDFSTPDSSMSTLDAVVAKGKAVVFGTTGFSDDQKAKIKKASETTRIVLAPNMSIGVNVLFKIAGDVARIMGNNYDVEIVEAHHKFKKDAPSGTAVKLSEVIADALDRNLKEVGVYGRHGFSEGRTVEEIGVHTVRAGDIVGEHRVMFGGMGETLELFHKAQSRDTFARGAVHAAAWLVNQKPGLYDMQDVLGLREK